MKKVKLVGGNLEDALKQVEGQDALSIKERNCLRLLTEEIFSACKELAGVLEMDFTLGVEGKKYELTAATKTPLDLNTRDQLLSMSSSGKNTANKGLKGFFGAVLDVLFEPGVGNPIMLYGMMETEMDYSGYWSMSQFMNKAPTEAVEKEWDGLERSILASFSDEVAIGVRSGRLEIRVIKEFR